MDKRRVLVIGNDNGFFDTLGDILMPFEFETHLVESDEDSVRMVRALRPDAAFVCAEISDVSRLSLCSKIKKSVGSRIPVILLTASLPKSDMALHSKQRYHADAYLEMHELSSDQLFEKLDNLIGLSSNGKHLSPLESNATDSDNEPFTTNGIFNTESVGADQNELNSDNNLGGADQDDKPSWLGELFDKVIDNSAEDTALDISQTKHSIDTLLKGDWENYNDLEHRMLEQEREIYELRDQLDEALRQARSSPFSSDYLSLRQDASLKQKEIGRLKKQLNDSQRKLVVSEERLRELAKRLLSIQTEFDQIKTRKAELALSHEAAQAELAKLNTAFEESRKHHNLKIDELEVEHRAELEKIAEKHKATVESLKIQIQAEKDKKQDELQTAVQNELKNIYKEHEAYIAELKAEHAEQISQLTSNNNNEIRQFESKLEKAQSEHQVLLQKIKDDHQKELDSLNKQAKKEKEIAEAHAKSELHKENKKIRQEHEEFVSKLKQKHSDEIAELKSAKDEAQNGAIAKIEAITKNREAAFKQMEEQYQSEIVNLKDQIQAKKAEAVSAAKSELQQALEKLHREYDELKSKAKQDHAFEMAKHKSDLNNAQQRFESEFNRLKNENLAALKAQDDKHRTEIEGLKKKIQEEKDKAKKAAKIDSKGEITKIEKGHGEDIAKISDDDKEEITRLSLAIEELKKKLWEEGKLHKSDLQAFDKKYKEGLHALDVEYASRIGRIREEKDVEIEALKKKMAEDAQKAAEKLNEEKHAHKKTRIDLDCRIAELLVRNSTQ